MFWLGRGKVREVDSHKKQATCKLWGKDEPFQGALFWKDGEWTGQEQYPAASPSAPSEVDRVHKGEVHCDKILSRPDWALLFLEVTESGERHARASETETLSPKVHSPAGKGRFTPCFR